MKTPGRTPSTLFARAAERPDPIKLGDAFSEVVRKRTIDWYRETLLTRLDDKKSAWIVVLMQRVHQQDLVGYLQEQDSKFEVLNLPAIAPTGSRIAVSASPNLTVARTGTYRRVNRRPPASLNNGTRRIATPFDAERKCARSRRNKSTHG